MSYARLRLLDGVIRFVYDAGDAGDAAYSDD